mmetsp:Transcript_15514/g.32774  ORF Transcript_15514/g.32774 Transcript_15514/m.32774 type:complete len:217 (-) Transcript_15514:535-1185(-)
MNITSFQSMLIRVIEFLYLSFLPVNSWGILMNMPSVKSPGPFLYSTDKRTLQPAPPHMVSSAVPSFVTSPALISNFVNFTTSLSFGKEPTVCMALVSHAGPISFSSPGVRGNFIPQNSPGSSLTTASLKSFIFVGRSMPQMGHFFQRSSGKGSQSAQSKSIKRSLSPPLDTLPTLDVLSTLGASRAGGLMSWPGLDPAASAFAGAATGSRSLPSLG